MPYSVTATFSQEQIKVENVKPIEMFVLNASLSGWDPQYYVNYNIDVYGYQMNQAGSLTDTEQLYTGLPIKTSPVQTNTDEEISGVQVSIPNTDRVVEGLIQNNDYLRGRSAHFIYIFSDNLQVGSTANHIGVTEDKNAAMIEKLYIVNATSDENAVSFTCKPKFIIKNIVLPGRTHSKGCSWVTYTGTECDPTSAINTASYPDCDFSLKECEERNNTARFGGFPSIPNRGIVIIS